MKYISSTQFHEDRNWRLKSQSWGMKETGNSAVTEKRPVGRSLKKNSEQ